MRRSKAGEAEAERYSNFFRRCCSSHFTTRPTSCGAVAGTNQERIGSLHHHQIGNSYRSDEFRGTPNEVPGGIQRKHTSGGNICAATFGQKFVNGGPGADIAPTDLRRNDKYWSVPGITRGWLEQGVIDRNIFQARIFATKRRRVTGCADCFRKAHQRRMRFGQMMLETFKESGDTPEKHSRIPEITSRGDVPAGQLQGRLLCESTNGIGTIVCCP